MSAPAHPSACVSLIDVAATGCARGELEHHFGPNVIDALLRQGILWVEDSPRHIDCTACGDPHIETLHFDPTVGHWYWICNVLGKQYADVGNLELLMVDVPTLARHAAVLLGFPAATVEESDDFERQTFLLGSIGSRDKTVFLSLGANTAEGLANALKAVKGSGSKSGGWVIYFSAPPAGLEPDRKHLWTAADEILTVDGGGLSPSPGRSLPWATQAAGKGKARERQAWVWDIFNTREAERRRDPDRTLKFEGDEISRLMPNENRLSSGRIQNIIGKAFRAERAGPTH